MTEENATIWMVTPASMKEVEAADPSLIDFMKAEAGYLPNSYRMMARSPELTRAMREVARVVLRSGKVDLGLKLLVGHVTSQAAGCRYCSAHTGSGMAKRGKVDEAKVDAVWDFENSPLFSVAERAALSLALAGGSTPNTTTPAHFEALRRYYNEEEILELVAVIAFYGFWNRWNETLISPIEERPLAFGLEHLQGSGWDPGKHVSVAIQE